MGCLLASAALGLWWLQAESLCVDMPVGFVAFVVFAHVDAVGSGAKLHAQSPHRPLPANSCRQALLYHQRMP